MNKPGMEAGPAHAFPTQGHADIDTEKSREVSNKTSFPKPDRCFHFLLMALEVCFVDLLLCLSFPLGHQFELILIDTAMPHMKKQEEIAQNFNTFAIIAL